VTSCRILLADDHTLVRAGIRSLLEAIAGVVVVGEASNGRQALGLTKLHRPDIVMLDVSMPELDGLETAGQIRVEFPECRTIILSMHAGPDFLVRALQFGVAGYLLKEAAATELETAIKAAMRGEVYLSPQISKQVVEGYVNRGRDTKTPTMPLTPRQREILRFVAGGANTKSIASWLDLSVKTVEAHRAELMRRLGIRDIPSLVKYALREGLITIDG
jgi:DNA-binding NarL/FixJ family response regulator